MYAVLLRECTLNIFNVFDVYRRRTAAISTIRMAVPILQGFGRCVIARKRVVLRAKEVFRRVFDDEFNTYYYVNMSTKHSTWTKPKVMNASLNHLKLLCIVLHNLRKRLFAILLSNNFYIIHFHLLWLYRFCLWPKHPS